MRKAIAASKRTDVARKKFLKVILGDATGYVCIAAISARGRFNERFFKYPDEIDDLLAFVNKKYATHNLYFCPQLFERRRRAKDTVSHCQVAWADLDECEPSLVSPTANIVLRTSANRYQAYWLFDSLVDPLDAEDASRRIAYKHEPFGVDRSGWDLTQLLRLPETYNIKRDRFIIHVEMADNGHRYDVSEFKKLPQIPGYEFVDTPLPPALIEQKPDKIFEKYKGRLDTIVLDLYRNEPEEDWSAALWLLERTLFEAGLSREEVFVVCHHAACNKYRRDKRPPQDLWRDVCKAYMDDDFGDTRTTPKPDSLLTSEEKIEASKYESFVERYIKWAQQRTDAAPQYHEGCAFVILSSLLAGSLKAHTAFGTIVPNLWFMLLGDTTISRKSTAMDMAMALLLEVNEDALMATDGSVEGLMTAIASRPGTPSLFWRDEFSGFLEAMQRRDYLSGMSETLTKLYDAKPQKRLLRKETIVLRDPILVLLCGGIKRRIQGLITTEQIFSGFIPRFIFISGYADISRFKPLGPGQDDPDSDDRDDLIAELAEIDDRYNTPMTIHIGSQEVSAPSEYEVELTPEAWERHNQFIRQMYDYAALAPDTDVYLPAMDRLAMSGLKCAMLLAASRQNPDNKGKVIVEMKDVLRAIYYIDRWREHTVDTLDNVGQSNTENRIDEIWRFVRSKTDGVNRSAVMQMCRLTAREADWIFETLEQRGAIRRQRRGRKETIYPARKAATVREV